MEGVWYDRTAYGEASRRGERVSQDNFAEQEVVNLSTLPCWQGLSPEEIRERIAYLLESIERQHAEGRRAQGKAVLGAKAVRRRHPHRRPKKLESSPAPRFHAATKEAWQALADADREFTGAFREAAELLKLGDPKPGFPPGSFPPGMPYVPHQAPG